MKDYTYSPTNDRPLEYFTMRQIWILNGSRPHIPKRYNFTGKWFDDDEYLPARAYNDEDFQKALETAVLEAKNLMRKDYNGYVRVMVDIINYVYDNNRVVCTSIDQECIQTLRFEDVA